jgi:hypothetical protein
MSRAGTHACNTKNKNLPRVESPTGISFAFNIERKKGDRDRLTFDYYKSAYKKITP